MGSEMPSCRKALAASKTKPISALTAISTPHPSPTRVKMPPAMIMPRKTSKPSSGLGGGLDAICRLLCCQPQRLQTRLLQIVPVKQVVGIEGDQPAVRMDDVHSGLLDRAHVEVVGIHELHDDHPEDVVVADRAGRVGPGQAAEQVAQAAGA